MSCAPKHRRLKLTTVAGAYWGRKNPQLNASTAPFKNKTQLDEYFAMLEEAKKRDHRKLGKSWRFT
jgi:threonyl-tRNA synthetase